MTIGFTTKPEQPYFMDNNIGYYDEYNKTQYEPGENEYDTFFMQFTYTVSGNEVSITLTNGIQHYYTYNDGVLDSGGNYYIPKISQTATASL